jgi:folate-binding protein YgfZ
MQTRPNDRSVLEISGDDRERFLQGLVTNDVTKARDGIIYAALLTAQGKFVVDFFIVGQPGMLLIDVAAPFAAMLAQRLGMYRLRSDVQIAPSSLIVSRGTGAPPEGALSDPRDPSLGWRLYSATDVSDATDWSALRVGHLIPETGIELTPDTYILEAGFERLHGVDFRKGCYVGQEVTARMKHKTELRKGLVQVIVKGSATPGTPVMAGEKEAGTLFTQSGGQGIAWLRFDRASGVMTAGDAVVRLREADLHPPQTGSH